MEPVTVAQVAGSTVRGVKVVHPIKPGEADEGRAMPLAGIRDDGVDAGRWQPAADAKDLGVRSGDGVDDRLVLGREGCGRRVEADVVGAELDRDQGGVRRLDNTQLDRKSTRLNSSH